MAYKILICREDGVILSQQEFPIIDARSLGDYSTSELAEEIAARIRYLEHFKATALQDGVEVED